MNSNFENDVDFSNTEFKKTLSFAGTEFSGKTDFKYAKFSDYAYFQGATFSDHAYFRGATFNGYAYFKGATFINYAHFQEANFNGPAHFQEANFNDNAAFKLADFNDNATFKLASFNDNVDFHEAIFSDKAYFEGATFNGYADFKKTTFNGYADFRKTTFSEYVDFHEAIFSDKANFHEANFNNVIVYGWSSLKDALDFDGPTYMKLIQNFRANEQFDDADDAYYQYRLQSQANKKVSLSKLADMFMWLTCGYGVKPYRTIIFGGLIVLLFSLVYWRRDGISRLKEDYMDESRHMSFFDAFYFSLVTFTTVGYGDWYPKDRYRKYVMIEGLLGWIILALFLVTLTNVMIRP